MDHKVSVNVASIRQAAQLIILLACMGANSGCVYYKSVGYDNVATRPKKFCKNLRSSLDADKYVIVHQGNDMWHLNNLFLDLPDKKHYAPDYNVMYGSLEDVDSLCAFYDKKYRAANRRAMRYHAADEAYVTSQVHVFVSENHVLYQDTTSIPIAAINRIEAYNLAPGRSHWYMLPVYVVVDILVSPRSSSEPAPKPAPNNVHHGPRGTR